MCMYKHTRHSTPITHIHIHVHTHTYTCVNARTCSSVLGGFVFVARPKIRPSVVCPPVASTTPRALPRVTTVPLCFVCVDVCVDGRELNEWREEGEGRPRSSFHVCVHLMSTHACMHACTSSRSTILIFSSTIKKLACIGHIVLMGVRPLLPPRHIDRDKSGGGAVVMAADAGLLDRGAVRAAAAGVGACIFVCVFASFSLSCLLTPQSAGVGERGGTDALTHR